MWTIQIGSLLRRIGLAVGMMLVASALVAGDDPKEEKPADNAYAPKKGLSPADLRRYIERMQDAPASIHERPGYSEGIIEAAERILATKPEGEPRRFAILAEFLALHDSGAAGNDESDKKLFELSEKFRDDKDKLVAKDAKFYLLEKRVLAADDVEPAKLPPLLDEIRETLKDQSLDSRHVRIASAAVRIINRVPDDDMAAKSYKEFGELFSKSEDDELSKYGKTIAKGSRPPTLIGKPIAIAGTTLEGTKFDISEYKGKVVVVDFWATWCGPCRASLPGLIKTHEQFHKQGFEVIGVSLDQDLDALGKFLDENKLPWVNLIGDKDADEIKFPLAEKYEIQAIPTMFLVGKDGRVIARDLSEKELEKKLEELLGDDAKKSTGGPAGHGQTVARCGQGWLETIDGYPVLHLKGTPYEMGYQHGALLKESVRSNMRNILEVEGSTAIKLGPISVKPRWVMDAIPLIERPFVPDRYIDEMNGLAAGSGMKPEDVVAGNFVPELFHCSGFAIMNSATKDGTLYHGRVLDYAIRWHLQEHAVLIVAEPEGSIPFVNVSYAGFIGSVTGMNAKHVSIGEMGGGGTGHWRGMPMPLLVREALEKAGDLDAAIGVFRDHPRTCQYFYVVADGNTNRAVGMEASWNEFRTVQPGQSDPLLPKPVKDCVLLSAGKRYEELVKRTAEGHGKFDASSALHLMDCPVAMKSNLHDVLFAPASTKLWVANASVDLKPAAEQPYHEFQLTELLARKPDSAAKDIPLEKLPKISDVKNRAFQGDLNGAR